MKMCSAIWIVFFVVIWTLADSAGKDGARQNMYLAASDVAGVALIGVQQLHRMMNEQKRLTDSLTSRTDQLEQLQSEMTELKQLVQLVEVKKYSLH